MEKLTDYIKRVPNFLSSQECKEIVQFLAEEGEWRKNEFYHPYTNTTSTRETEDESYMCNDFTPYNSLIIEKLYFEIVQYQVFAKTEKVWGTWEGYSPIRFNRYEKGQNMQKHVDHITSIFDGDRKGIPTITLLMAFNDDYEGGALRMFSGEDVYLEEGELIIFPSNFLYPHEVATVTGGTRYTGVSWVY
jgi:predicted 2-oxoglutarate/Fe(II)-dependent dioxygenase YbiX